LLIKGFLFFFFQIFESIGNKKILNLSLKINPKITKSMNIPIIKIIKIEDFSFSIQQISFSLEQGELICFSLELQLLVLQTPLSFSH
jgi:hypothetical protein